MIIVRRIILVSLVVMALCWAVAFFGPRWGVMQSGSFIEGMGYVFFAIMTALSVLFVYLNWHSYNESLKRIHEQIEQFEQSNQVGMIMVDADNELAELVKTINQYLTNVKLRFEKDTIQRKELELQANAAESERRRSEAIVSSIPDAVLVTDRFGEIILANRAGQDLFDFDMEIVYRMPANQAICDERILQVIAQAERYHNGQAELTFDYIHPVSKKRVILEAHANAILDLHQEFLGVVVVVHDVTADKEMAQMKDDFVNSVTHELKTPLASIKAYAEMLADGEAGDSQSQKEFCRIIEEQADRLHRLIDNILNLSRIESGKLNADKKPVDIIELIRQVITTMMPQARDKEISLVCDIDSYIMDADTALLADRDMIYQALLNLVSNAIKYSPRNSRVDIVLEGSKDSCLQVKVIDSGPGIPKECRERVFDKFYRVKSNNHMAGGTGLGLHLVRRIVENMHNGRVTLDSTPGKGSTFTIALPVNCAVGSAG